MKLPLLLLCCLQVGCARGTLAVLVPRLELVAHLVRHGHEGAQARVVLGAHLRWQPRVGDPSARTALSSAAALSPCEATDAACLTEHAEAEPEIAALREGAP